MEQQQVMYASALSRDPEATYRQVDLVGRTTQADGPALVQLLYDELVRALRVAAWATEHGDFRMKATKITRATAILFALEAGLDYGAGGDLPYTLARVYGGARRTIVDASVGQDPAPFRAVAQDLSEIAEAWQTIRAA